jgi:predicted amidophosphoribosyltransferase
MKVQRTWSNYFRSCHLCSSGRVPMDLYCESCWTHYFEPLQATDSFAQNKGKFELYSLFEWRSELVGHLIHALKQGQRPSAFERLSLWFSLRRSHFGKIGPCVFIPSPPKANCEEDHAVLWGQALARRWKSELWMGLQREDQEEQKRRRLSQRGERRLRVVKNLKDINSGSRRIIFVDDVYTSGATARAAFEALGQPTGFEVWTVACRPRLILV